MCQRPLQGELHLGRTARAASREPQGGDRAGLGGMSPWAKLPLLPFLESDYDRESHDQQVAETTCLKDALVHLV